MDAIFCCAASGSTLFCRAFVGVVLDCEFAERAFDFAGVGVPGEAEDGVVVFLLAAL